MNNYVNKKFHISRLTNYDICKFGLKKHHFKYLIEVDVTLAREKINDQKALKRDISFSAWIIKCICDSIDQFKNINAIMVKHNIMRVFEDVDIEVMVEKRVDGENIPIPLVIRKANKKNIDETTKEIRAAQNRVIDNSNITLCDDFYTKYFYKLPGFLRMLVWKFIMKSPNLIKKYFGNVSITSVGMIDRFNGWIVPISVSPLTFGVGSITEKVVVLNGEFAKREILNLTILFDHDVIDGGDATRFSGYLTRLMESGHGL